MQDVPVDAFSALFAEFTPNARAFFAGNLCTRVEFDDVEERGHLHVLRGGVLKVTRPGVEAVTLDRPSMLLWPRRVPHRFEPDAKRGADLVCATIDLGAGAGNPLAAALPDVLILPIDRMPTIAPTLDLLFGEAFAARGGRQAALDRLFEYLLVQVFRDIVDEGRVSAGVLAALADPHLRPVLAAMHERPGRLWSLDALAELAGQSRTRFAEHFRAVVGATPIDYLTRWRMTVAQGLLRRGKPAKAVAAAVGYDSAAAWSRAFSKTVGLSPRDYLARSRSPAPAKDGDAQPGPNKYRKESGLPPQFEADRKIR